MITMTIPGPDGDDIAVPATWETCEYCGPHDPYDLAGRPANPCSVCNGYTKILLPDEAAMTPEQRDAWVKHEREVRNEWYRILRERGTEY